MGIEQALLAPDARENDASGPAIHGRLRRGGGLPRGLVESVRLIIIALGAAGGWEVAASTGGARSGRLLLGIVLGTAIGYVAGGAFGRTTAHAVSDLERELMRVPASDLLGGGWARREVC